MKPVRKFSESVDEVAIPIGMPSGPTPDAGNFTKGALILLFFWVFFGAAGFAQAAPGESGGGSNRGMRTSIAAREARQAHGMALNGGATREQAARAAGEAAGRAVAREGGSPAEAGALAAQMVRTRDGSARDAVSVAAGAAGAAEGSSIEDIAQAAGNAARAGINQVLRDGERTGNVFAASTNASGLTNHLMSEVVSAAQESGSEPAQTGRALGAAVRQAVGSNRSRNYESTISRGLQDGSGSQVPNIWIGGNPLAPLKDLSARDKGILYGNALLGLGFSRQEAASEAGEFLFGMKGWEQVDVNAVQNSITTPAGEKPEKSPDPKKSSESQSRRADAGGGPNLAGMGRVLGGLGGEGRSSVSLPTGGGAADSDSLTSARGAAKSGYRVVPQNQPGRTASQNPAGGQPQTGGSQQTATNQQTTGTQPAGGGQVASAPSPVKTTASVGFLGQWGLEKGNCGVDKLSFTGSKESPILNAGGQSVPVSVRDNVAVTTKITLKGYANSRLTMTERGNQLQAVGGLSDGKGSVCTMLLTRINF